MANINWDAGDVLRRLGKLGGQADDVVDGALGDAADTTLLMSIGGAGFPAQVPHDIGSLQGSAVVENPKKLHRIVGFHTPYAARLHEHPEFRFQKGRKGKYLEDPIIDNGDRLKRAFQAVVKRGLSAL